MKKEIRNDWINGHEMDREREREVGGKTGFTIHEFRPTGADDEVVKTMNMNSE